MDDQRGAFKRNFASTLLGWRADAQIGSQAELAKKVGVSEATARRWESLTEPHLPDAWELHELCRVLGCEPDDLVNPSEMSSRERQLARRVARGARRAIGQEPQAS